MEAKAGTELDAYLVRMLRAIYDCKYSFEVKTINRKTKTLYGSYSPGIGRMRIYPPTCGSMLEVKDTAIHEYAHHIHYSEKDKDGRRQRPHGPQFWRIYSALMCLAQKKGIFRDELIEDLVDKI